MPTRPRRPARVPFLVVVALLAVALVVPTSASATSSPSKAADATLLRYARDTWASFVAMVDPASGLPADSLSSDGTTSVQTSVTNIGAYMWSTLVADRLGIIDHAEAVARLEVTLGSLETMEIHEPSGQYYNWYDHHTGAKLTAWPPTGAPLTPILSSVDNGWLATGLHVIASAVPEVADRAQALFDRMDFGFYYRPAVNRIAFHVAPDTGDSPCCYDTIVSESRIASYIGIAKGELPAKHYFGTWRTFPDIDCKWSWQEQRPVGRTRNYLGVDVFEGTYTYRGMRIVPGWGGSMFESLMPAMFVPEEKWPPRSWGTNHRLTVRAHREHGLDEAKYGYWGFSPASEPGGGYREYGVDAIGLNPDGYLSDAEKTNYDAGYDGCRVGKNPTPTYGDGVVTPHALFLAMHMEPREAYDNLVASFQRPAVAIDFEETTPEGEAYVGHLYQAQIQFDAPIAVRTLSLTPIDPNVLVQIHAAGVNPLDSKIRSGEFKRILPYRLPLILGNEVAGVVARVGSRVRRFKPGDEVYARPDQGRIGAFAEFISITEADVAHKPKALTMEEAASIPLVGLTAWRSSAVT